MIIHSIEDSFSFALADLLTLDTEINEATYSALRGRASSAISKKKLKGTNPIAWPMLPGEYHCRVH